MKILAEYDNGNYHVKLYEDGTKEKYTDDDEFDAAFPDSMDIKITNYCDMGCPMCHEKSTTEGKHGTLDAVFLDKLPSGIELAIGGGNPLSHPDLIPFLERMKQKGIVCNITVNEIHLLNNIDYIKELLDKKLIYGLGISVNKYTKEMIEFTKSYPNTVLHVILGIVDWDKLMSIANHKNKILILGYKIYGRGIANYSDKIKEGIKETENRMKEIFNYFDVVSFDNLALDQLHVKRHLDKTIWDEFYMGDDGTSTMYVDLVDKKFAKTSCWKKRYDLLDNIEDMLKVIKSEKE